MYTSDVSYELLTEENKEYFRDKIEAYNSGISRYNEVLKKNSPRRDVTTFLFIDTRNGQIIGYLAYCCSLLSVGRDIHPAIEIKTFAVDEKYRHNARIIQKLDDTEHKCTSFIFSIGIELLTCIGNTILSADYIFLKSENHPKVKNFYRDNDFVEFATTDNIIRYWGSTTNSDYFLYEMAETNEYNVDSLIDLLKRPT